MTIRSLSQGMLLSALLVGAFRTGAWGQDTPQTTGGRQIIETKAATPTPIPDFAAVYGLSFHSIHSLGHRLMEARQTGDPVALALIGTELAVDEEVSGKKADLTSADVLNEAKDLAKMRRKEKELAAVAVLLKDKAAAKELTDLVEPAKKAEAERITRFKSGERGKGIRILAVVNRTQHHLSIRVNGEHVGWIDPFTRATSSFPNIITTFLCFNCVPMTTKVRSGTLRISRVTWTGSNGS